MSDDKTIIEESMAQTDEAIASVIELGAICDNLIDERNNLATQNAMLRDCLSLWEPKGMLAIMRMKALDATQADVDAWKARNNCTPK